AIEDKDGDAIGAIVAANAPHAVNAARQMEGPGSVADFESLVYAGVNKAVQFLQSPTASKMAKTPVWVRLRSNIRSAVQDAATPAKRTEEGKVERVLREGASSIEAAAEAGREDGRGAAELVADMPADAETAAARDSITEMVSELMEQGATPEQV
ncbi:hypothetical protein R0K19_21050, partial [Bacillus sp. SIMBA_161]